MEPWNTIAGKTCLGKSTAYTATMLWTWLIWINSECSNCEKIV